jgi:hypothetical protein
MTRKIKKKKCFKKCDALLFRLRVLRFKSRGKGEGSDAACGAFVRCGIAAERRTISKMKRKSAIAAIALLIWLLSGSIASAAGDSGRAEAPMIPKTVGVYALVNSNSAQYLAELGKVPKEIRKAYSIAGWHFVYGEDVLEEYDEDKGDRYVGLTSYRTKTTYVEAPTSTVHEFGHFLYWAIGVPDKVTELYEDEARVSQRVLRKYSATNCREYFADYFDFWIENRDDGEKMEQLREATPATYKYFEELESSGWVTVQE